VRSEETPLSGGQGKEIQMSAPDSKGKVTAGRGGMTREGENEQGEIYGNQSRPIASRGTSTRLDTVQERVREGEKPAFAQPAMSKNLGITSTGQPHPQKKKAQNGERRTEKLTE